MLCPYQVKRNSRGRNSRQSQCRRCPMGAKLGWSASVNLWSCPGLLPPSPPPWSRAQQSHSLLPRTILSCPGYQNQKRAGGVPTLPPPRSCSPVLAAGIHLPPSVSFCPRPWTTADLTCNPIPSQPRPTMPATSPSCPPHISPQQQILYTLWI